MRRLGCRPTGTNGCGTDRLETLDDDRDKAEDAAVAAALEQAKLEEWQREQSQRGLQQDFIDG